MLDSPTTYTAFRQSNKSRPNGHAITFISGPALRRLLRGRSPKERARIAAMLVKHGVAIIELSPVQAARLVGVEPAYLTGPLGHRGSRGPRDKTINHLLKHYGAETLMRAVDRATAPQIAAE
jgi:hypothetical protein